MQLTKSGSAGVLEDGKRGTEEGFLAQGKDVLGSSESDSVSLGLTILWGTQILCFGVGVVRKTGAIACSHSLEWDSFVLPSCRNLT